MTHDEEIVEAVARAIYAAQCESYRAKPGWGDEPPEIKKLHRSQARAAITAYQAEAWQGESVIQVTDDMIEAGKEAAWAWTDRYMDGAEFVRWDDALPDIFNRMLGLSGILPPAPKATP